MYEDLLFAGINLKLLGRAKVRFTHGIGEDKTNYKAEEIYIDERVYVFGARESILCVVRPSDSDVCRFLWPYKVALHFADT